MPPSLIDQTKDLFLQTFGGQPATAVLAPGRVNLIGEHTDYNEGYVLPMAVDKGVALAGRKRPDNKVVLYSADYQQKEEFQLEAIRPDLNLRWANYFKGVAALLRKNGVFLGGCEVVLKGNLPQGAGLSSSAALEVATAVLFQKLFQVDLKDLDLVLLAQKAENDFVGVQCGIMDQFASYMGGKDHALFLDCRSLEHDWVPLGTDYKVVVFNTGVKRELASSDYNIRRKQCQEGVQKLGTVLPGLKSLRDVSLCDFEKHQRLLEPVILKRCRHVISENQRVLDAVEALKLRNMERVKVLFRESHESLRDDYEVSCHELDTLVELAQEHPLQKGSRMTGGGFGGCTVHLVPAEEQVIGNFVSFVSEGYERRIGRKPEYYIFSPSAGAKFLNG
ncbi:MAG TPA: galactokinase [bacterium]|nr:galactokinase [bacterium]